MKLYHLLTLNVVIALVNGLLFVLVPATAWALYGVVPGPAVTLLSRFLGTELITVGLICWFNRKVSDPATQRGFALAFLVGHVLGLIVSLMGVLASVLNVLGWLFVLLYLVMSLGFAYVLMRMPRGS
jgi:hypothetical protein